MSKQNIWKTFVFTENLGRLVYEEFQRKVCECRVSHLEIVKKQPAYQMHPLAKCQWTSGCLEISYDQSSITSNLEIYIIFSTCVEARMQVPKVNLFRGHTEERIWFKKYVDVTARGRTTKACSDTLNGSRASGATQRKSRRPRARRRI